MDIEYLDPCKDAMAKALREMANDADLQGCLIVAFSEENVFMMEMGEVPRGMEACRPLMNMANDKMTELVETVELDDPA